ncbi:MAG: hypothetical protein K1Y36_29570 [Blastocatellia bacterium]|nr:hypothetical protein [Blastocatellia bacterium]
MADNWLSNRAFEHVIGGSRQHSATKSDFPEGREYIYERLLRVSYINTFYNRTGDFACPDFTVYPTPTTAALMHSLGLILKAEPAGFSVFYDTKQTEGLFTYLRRQAEQDGSHLPPQCWTRLSFSLASTNPLFVNLSEVPIDTNPMKENFYFTNQEVTPTEVPDLYVLRRKEDQDTDHELLEVVPVEIQVPVTPEVARVEVKSISGKVVLCKPTCAPPSLLLKKLPSQITCQDVEGLPPGPNWKCTSYVYLDFALLPEGRYTIVKVNSQGIPVAPPEVILYTMSAPLPLCFVNLLFTDPNNPSRPDHGVYPVKHLFPKPGEKTEIVPTFYETRFTARQSTWSYYVVPQPQNETFRDLKIEDVTPTSTSRIHFAGPFEVTLPNQTKAFQFLSQEPIPLQQQSHYVFRLKGKHPRSHGERTLIHRLPAASPAQVLPKHKGEVFLALAPHLPPDARTNERYHTILSHLFAHFRVKTGKTEFLRRLQLAGAHPRSRPYRELVAAYPERETYADIYVYV